MVRGDFQEALGCIRKASSLTSLSAPLYSGQLAGLLMKLGKEGEAEEMLTKFGDGKAYGAPIGLAIFNLVRGEPEKAADWFVKAIEQRDPIIPNLLRGPLAAALRETPRWAELHRMIGSPGTL